MIILIVPFGISDNRKYETRICFGKFVTKTNDEKGGNPLHDKSN